MLVEIERGMQQVDVKLERVQMEMLKVEWQEARR